MWFSALLCCGSVVVAVACSGLGPLGPRSPSPLRLGFLFFAVSLFVWPVDCHSSGRGVRRRVQGVFSSVLFGGSSIVLGCFFWLGVGKRASPYQKVSFSCYGEVERHKTFSS